MYNFFKVAAFALVIVQLTALNRGKSTSDELSDYEESQEHGKYNKIFDLRGTLRERFGLVASLQNSDVSSVCSPISALLPLGKLALGAHGSGLKELNNAIGVSSDGSHDTEYEYNESESLKNHLSGLINDLEDLPGVTLDVASRLYVPEDKRLYKNYTKAAKRIFKTSIEKVNFNEPESVAESINNWVSLQTHGMITNLISPQDMSPGSSLIIVNAIYFAGKWEDPFKKVEPGSFYSSNGVREVPMMSNTGWYNYGDSDVLSAQLVQIPYIGKKSSFLIVLPKEKDGSQKLLKRLQRKPELLAQAMATLQYENIKLTIPKFRIESQWDLKLLYRKVGLNKIFRENKSGLTGIVRDEQLDVSGAIQKAVIEVTELGTEAAAASDVIIWKFAVPPIPYMKADHPFLFYVLLANQQLFSGVYAALD